MSAQTRQAAGDYSRGRGLSRAIRVLATPMQAAVLATGAAGALLLIVAEFCPLYEVTSIAATLEKVSGGSQHSFALVLLGVAALPLVWGAARARSRPAMAAIGAVGLIALAIALIGDLPNVNRTGTVKRQFYSEATARPKAGFYLETLGAVLLVIAGATGLVLSAPSRASTGVGRPEPDAERPTPEPPGERVAEERARAAAERAERRRARDVALRVLASAGEDRLQPAAASAAEHRSEPAPATPASDADEDAATEQNPVAADPTAPAPAPPAPISRPSRDGVPLEGSPAQQAAKEATERAPAARRAAARAIRRRQGRRKPSG